MADADHDPTSTQAHDGEAAHPRRRGTPPRTPVAA